MALRSVGHALESMGKDSNPGSRPHRLVRGSAELSRQKVEVGRNPVVKAIFSQSRSSWASSFSPRHGEVVASLGRTIYETGLSAREC
jgi:hypothetical protein